MMASQCYLPWALVEKCFDAMTAEQFYPPYAHVMAHRNRKKTGRFCRLIWWVEAYSHVCFTIIWEHLGVHVL